ncbi:hypothetical protein HC928_11705, partial [bacterium]|nr:hypothetical protein [bacterium]
MDRRSKHWITVTMWIALAALFVAVILNAAAISEAWMLLPLTMVPLTFGV